MGTKGVFYEPPTPPHPATYCLLLVLLYCKRQSDSGLSSCGGWARGPFLAKEQAGGGGGGQSRPVTQVYAY